MHRAKGLDDLFFVGGQPRLRRFDYVPPEVRQRRATYAVEPSILTHGAGSLAEVRGRVVDAIGDFVGQLHTNLGRAQLISAAPGAGKSTAVAKSIRKHHIEARIVVGTKALAQELAEDHLYNLIVGRNHTNCDRYDVVKRLGESGHRVEGLACGTPNEPRCPFFSRCRYFAQFHAAGPRVAATEQLFNPTFLAGGELAVVDDAELPRALIERWTVTGAVLERAVGQLSERGDPVLLSLLPILQHAIIDGPNEVLTGAHVWDQLAATAARYDRDIAALVRSLPVRNLIPEPEEDEDGYLSVRSVEAVPPATIALVLDALKQELPAFEQGEDFNSRLALSRNGIVVGRMRQHAVDRKGRTMVEQMGMLVLDATPLHVLVDYLCATHERLPDVHGEIELPANVTVVQYASSTNGHSVLAQEKRVETVVAEIAAERLLAPVSDPSHEALITYKEALPLLSRAGFATGQMISFGAMRGTNAVENVRRLHMVGRPMPPTTATHYLAQIIHHDEPYVSPEVVIDRRQFAGQAQAVDVVDYADPRMAALLRSRREDEMTQAVHRARLFILDAQRDLLADGKREAVTLVIHTSHPIPDLRVDRLVVDGVGHSDVNLERNQAAVSRIHEAVAQLEQQGAAVSVQAVAREAGASWRTVRKALGTPLHTPVDVCSSTPKATGLRNDLHTLVGVEHPLFPRFQPAETAPEDLGNDLHTPLIDLLTRVQSCPQTAKAPSSSFRAHWVPCRGGCGTSVPPGQKCFDCAAAAVTAWKATQGRHHRQGAAA